MPKCKLTKFEIQNMIEYLRPNINESISYSTVHSTS